LAKPVPVLFWSMIARTFTRFRFTLKGLYVT
jgi:hypothetical protein